MNLGVDPSKVVITKLHLDPDRKQLLERKNRKKATDKNADKVKAKEVTLAAMD